MKASFRHADTAIYLPSATGGPFGAIHFAGKAYGEGGKKIEFCPAYVRKWLGVCFPHQPDPPEPLRKEIIALENLETRREIAGRMATP